MDKFSIDHFNRIIKMEKKINHERLRRELWIKAYSKTDVMPSYSADEAVRYFDNFFNKIDGGAIKESEVNDIFSDDKITEYTKEQLRQWAESNSYIEGEK